MEELKRLLEEAIRNFEEFKKKNDTELKELKAGNHIPADVKEQNEKLNNSIDDLQKKYDQIKTAMNRPEIPTEKAELDEFQKKSMNKFFKKGLARMTPEEVKSLSASTDDEGGFFVRTAMSDQIGTKLFESSPFRQFATVIQINTSVWSEVADYDEPAASWVGEKSTRSETDNNDIKKLEIPTHELYASPKSTQTLLEDGFLDVEAWHTRKVTEKFERAEATAFATGNGVTRPRGIASYTSGDGFNLVEQVNSGSAGAFLGDGLIACQNALFEPFQGNARWMMARASAGAVRKLKDGQGRYLWSVDRGLNNDMLNFLLGKPVHFASDIAAIASASLSAYYGDFTGYYIIDRVGISVLRDVFSDKPNVVFYTRKRVGAGMRDFQKIKIQKLSA